MKQNFLIVVALLAAVTLPGCRRQRDYPGDLNAYIANGKSDSVSVVDLGQFKIEKTLAVGRNPAGITANPKKNEIYVVNTASDNISFIDAGKNAVVATVGIFLPAFLLLFLPAPKREQGV